MDVGFIVNAVELVVQFWNDTVGRELSLFLYRYLLQIQSYVADSISSYLYVPLYFTFQELLETAVTSVLLLLLCGILCDACYQVFS